MGVRGQGGSVGVRRAGGPGGSPNPRGGPIVERARGERVGGRSANTVQFIHFNLSEGRGSRQWVSEGRGGPWVSEGLGSWGGHLIPGGAKSRESKGGH